MSEEGYGGSVSDFDGDSSGADDAPGGDDIFAPSNNVAQQKIQILMMVDPVAT